MTANEIEKQIRNNFFNFSFDVHLLSEKLNLSESYLREIINLHFNCSPHHLIETIRLEEAVRLLNNNDLKIYSIASRVGYSNLRTFRRSFYKRFSISPQCLKDLILNSENQSKEIERILHALWSFANNNHLYR